MFIIPYIRALSLSPALIMLLEMKASGLLVSITLISVVEVYVTLVGQSTRHVRL